jgi:hypothetical protein
VIRGVLVSMLVLVLVACGSGDPEQEPTPEAADQNDGSVEDADVAEDAEEAIEDAEELAEDLRDQVEAEQEASGGGQAELTVGDDTWTFGSVLCAFGPDEIGQEDAEFVLSAIQDGLQLYVSIDGFGHSVTLDDIDDFEDPSVGWSAGGPVAAMAGDPEEFVQVDGKQVRAEAEFTDSRDGLSSTTVPGTLEATCP